MDKSLLLKLRLPEGDVDLPGVGVVRVRGLSRAEAMTVRGLDDPAETERRVLALGMVDPTVTVAEAEQWQKSATHAELETVTERIAQLSGLAEESPKEAYKSVPGGPGA